MTQKMEIPKGWPRTPPTLKSERLELREHSYKDADAVYDLFNSLEVARMTSTIPHPFLPQAAFGWISTKKGRFVVGQGVEWAITEARIGRLIGSIGLFRLTSDSYWELGYSINPNEAGNGYATEAAQLVMDWARRKLNVTCFVAGHFADNPASGKILTKLGFSRDGQEQMMYSLARGEKEPGYRYIWPADLADGVCKGPLH